MRVNLLYNDRKIYNLIEKIEKKNNKLFLLHDSFLPSFFSRLI